MMTGTSGRRALALGKSSRPLIPGMLMSERIKMRRPVACISDALKCHGGGLRKLHREAVSAEVAPELLAEQHLDIRLIVNHENEQVHACVLPIWQGMPPARGRTIRNSVNSPGWVSTSIDPPCCLTMMS